MLDNEKDPTALDVSIIDQVATIRVRRLSEALEHGIRADAHWALADALEDLRRDPSCRIVVITGSEDGEFMVTPPPSHYGGASSQSRHDNPESLFVIAQGTIRLHQVMTEMEKPIIAKVNGDAIGFGQSVMFASDLIVARPDAIVSDVHLGMGEVKTSDGRAAGPSYGIGPGDGAGALIPLYMAPPLAKEYLMLSRSLTTQDLADQRLINRVVPLDELDAAVDDLVAELLRRPAFVLAWTKRLVTRHVAAQLNLTLDVGMGYELVSLLQAQQSGFTNHRRLVGNSTSESEGPTGAAGEGPRYGAAAVRNQDSERRV